MQTDYLIIGQGLAGTFFAHQLSRHGHDFVILDPDGHNASKTAAGLLNPVVLKRFSPVWQGQAQIAAARQTVAELAEELSLSLDIPLPILRIFNNANDKHAWQKKAVQLNGLLDRECYPSPDDKIHAPLGVGRVLGGGRIDISSLLNGYRAKLSRQGIIRREHVDYRHLLLTDNHVQYKDISAKKVICCEGYGIKQNPYFNYLPLQGNKGEVLTVRLPGLHLDAALKAGVFILPQPACGADIYFVGATYNWTDKDSIPTAAGKKQLLDKLRQFYCGEVEVLTHRAGLRPTVTDRRPLLGCHKQHQNLYILNGLGTRGVMLGATMAKHLYQFIEAGIALPPEVCISRFPANAVV